MSQPSSPRARRLATPSWLDLRFALGVLMVLVAVVVGARVFASADHYTRVYVAAHPLVPGERLADGDLRVGQARFDGQGGRYVAASATPPTGYVVMRYVGAGELLPRAALARAVGPSAGTRLVTVPVQPGHLASDLGHGDLVDVYVTPKSPDAGKVPAPTRVLSAVPVDSTDGGSRSLGGSSSVSVVLAVPVAAVPETVKAVESGTIDLVRVPPSVAGAIAVPGSSPSP